MSRKAPKARDDQPVKTTRERILDAAIAVFARDGFAGARMDDIGRQASVNKNLIYHYYGSKKRLYRTVLESVYGAMREHQDRLNIETIDPEQGMRRLIAHTFDYFAGTPELLSLINTENLLRAKSLKSSRQIRPLYDPLLAALKTLLQRGTELGVFRTGVDPVDLYISISALGYFYLSNRWTLSHIFATELAAPKRLAQRRAHIVDVIIGYLKYGSNGSRADGRLAKASARHVRQAASAAGQLP